MKKGRKKLDEKYRLSNGRVALGEVRKHLEKEVGGTILIESEIPTYLGISDRQWSSILNGDTTQNSGDGNAAFNIATYDTLADRISHNTPQERWTNHDLRWTDQKSGDAGLKIYNAGVAAARSHLKKPGDKKRGRPRRAAIITEQGEP